MARRGRLTLPPLRRKGFVAWIYCWAIRSFMGSCRGLVRNVFLLCFYFIPVLFRILSLSSLSPHLFGLLVHVLLSLSRLSLLSVVYTHGSSDSFALLGVHASALLLSSTSFFSSPIWLPRHFVLHFSFLFVSSRLCSSLLPHYCPCFLYFVLAFFLPVVLRYIIIAIVSICLSAFSLFSLVFLPTINYTATITARRFRYQRHTINLYALYVIVSAFGIHTDGKRVLHNLLLTPGFIFD
ncbi:hypothetical protein BGY98DRAFT_541290 [Russula aff. rugulosa BPL654]|nr:hypothetical protein BGY98DRAFT_541290 [Russula aff. rugulosa BPL654]